MCSGSCDVFKFRDISDNISKTVQGRDIHVVEWEYNGKTVCGLSNESGTITSDLE